MHLHNVSSCCWQAVPGCWHCMVRHFIEDASKNAEADEVQFHDRMAKSIQT